MGHSLNARPLVAPSCPAKASAKADLSRIVFPSSVLSVVSTKAGASVKEEAKAEPASNHRVGRKSAHQLHRYPQTNSSPPIKPN